MPSSHACVVIVNLIAFELDSIDLRRNYLVRITTLELISSILNFLVHLVISILHQGRASKLNDRAIFVYNRARKETKNY